MSKTDCDMTRGDVFQLREDVVTSTDPYTWDVTGHLCSHPPGIPCIFLGVTGESELVVSILMNGAVRRTWKTFLQEIP